LAAKLCSFLFSSRRRHTRSTRDWSSDVCSSDLLHVLDARRERVAPRGFNGRGAIAVELPDGVDQCVDEGSVERGIDVEVAAAVEIGRASCRERVSMWVVVVCALRKSRINVKLRW